MAPNFNSKHLKTGDPLPPFTGKLRLYNLRGGPFAQRVIFALNAKNIDYEIVNVNYSAKPEWFERKSAFGKLPSLEIKEDLCLCESLPIVEYVDEVYPQRPLRSKDPVQRAFDKIIVETLLPVQNYFYKVIKADDVSEDMLIAHNKSLAFIQDQLKERGTPFLGGSEPGYADYMIWPWFERYLAFKDEDDRLKFDPTKYQLLLAYFERMQKDPVVSEYAMPDEKMVKFYEPYRLGLPYNNIDDD